MEDKESVKLDRCEHSTCISCYKKCNVDTLIEPPKFPYDDIITYIAYIKNPYHKRWITDSLIIKYKKELFIWNYVSRKSPEPNLRACCICRK